jgi:hypothetical protein
MKDIEDMTDDEKYWAIFSMRYILQEYFEQGESGVEALAKNTGYPPGVLKSALDNLFV